MEETYVAKLKQVYGKAYPQHDSASRDEDLLHRFLTGLMDQKAHQQVEFVKDPANIDEALDEIVRYHESWQSGQPQWDGNNKTFKAWAAQVNYIPSSDGELDSDEEGGEPNWLPEATFCSAGNLKVMASPAMQASLLGQKNHKMGQPL